MTDETQNPKTLETETCSRCGGSGHYSYCQSYGTTCFKCRGRKVVYTKRGAAAALYLEQLRSKRADEFKPGDLIFDAGVAGFSKAKFHKVTGLRVHTAAEKVAKGFKSMTNGVEVPQRDTLIIDCDGWHLETSPESMERRGCTKEEKAETFRQALEYQATLTKTGTVRKAKARAAQMSLMEAK